MESVGQIRRNPPRGGVGVREIPLLLQVAHGVSDGGRGHTESTPAGHGSTSRRLGGFHIGLYYGLQNGDFPVREVLTYRSDPSCFIHDNSKDRKA